MNESKDARTKLLDALPSTVKDQLISALVVALLLTNGLNSSGIFRSGKFTDTDAARMEAGIRGDFTKRMDRLENQIDDTSEGLRVLQLHVAQLPPPAWQDRIRKLEQHMYSGHD